MEILQIRAATLLVYNSKLYILFFSVRVVLVFAISVISVVIDIGPIDHVMLLIGKVMLNTELLYYCLSGSQQRLQRVVPSTIVLRCSFHFPLTKKNIKYSTIRF